MIKSLYKKVIPEKTRISLIQNLNRFFSFLYYGDKVYCNYCKQVFSKFKPKGNGLVIRQNAVCPKCSSVERTRLLLEFLKKETEIFLKPLKILHIAPEKSLLEILKKTKGEYIDGDINTALATYKIDITKINYPENYFDIIICSHVLGHIPNEEKAVAELYRVLQSKGKLIVQTLISSNEFTLEDNTINSSEQRLNKYGEHDLVRLHGQDFKKRLTHKNTIVTEIDYRKKFTDEELEKYCFGDGKRELIFICKKTNLKSNDKN